MIFICFDIISIIVNISNNQVVNLFKESTRFVKMNLSQKEKYLSDLEKGLIHPDGTLKETKVARVIELAQEESLDGQSKVAQVLSYQKP